MAIIRLLNGGDFTVGLSVTDVTDKLAKAHGDGFVELPTEEGPLHVRPSSVIAVIEDTKKKTAGFRVAG